MSAYDKDPRVTYLGYDRWDVVLNPFSGAVGQVWQYPGGLFAAQGIPDRLTPVRNNFKTADDAIYYLIGDPQ